MKFHVEGDEVDSDLITHHPFLKMIRRHLKKAGSTGTINGACLQPRATMKQIMHEISTLRTDVKERPSFLTANVIFFFGGGVSKIHLTYTCAMMGSPDFWRMVMDRDFQWSEKTLPPWLSRWKLRLLWWSYFGLDLQLLLSTRERRNCPAAHFIIIHHAIVFVLLSYIVSLSTWYQEKRNRSSTWKNWSFSSQRQ